MTTNPRKASVDIIYNILRNSSSLSDELNTFRAGTDMSQQDIRLVSELVNGVLRNLEYIDYTISLFSSIKLNKISPYILCVLRISVYQILFMDRIPESAAVNEGVKLAKKSNYKAASFVNALLRKISSNEENISLPKDRNKMLSIKYSCPQWIIEHWIDTVGEEAEQLAKAMNQKAATMLRVNKLKTTADNLVKMLNDDGWICEGYTSPVFPEIDYLISAEKVGNILTSDAYKKGLFYIQDSAGAYAGHVLNPGKDSVVIDMCASPGGKTTHLAEITQNSGIIHAFDVSEYKINRIEENLSRLGITCVSTKVTDSTVIHEEYIDTADFILVDAPCSGLGIIRKKPDIKYARKSEDIKELSEISLKILYNAAQYLKKGGRMVFSTCTTTYEENQGVLFEFLNHRKDFKLIKIDCTIQNDGYITLYPHRNDCDGFFISLLMKE